MIYTEINGLDQIINPRNKISDNWVLQIKAPRDTHATELLYAIVIKAVLPRFFDGEFVGGKNENVIFVDLIFNFHSDIFSKILLAEIKSLFPAFHRKYEDCDAFVSSGKFQHLFRSCLKKVHVLTCGGLESFNKDLLYIKQHILASNPDISLMVLDSLSVFSPRRDLKNELRVTVERLKSLQIPIVSVLYPVAKISNFFDFGDFGQFWNEFVNFKVRTERHGGFTALFSLNVFSMKNKERKMTVLAVKENLIVIG